MPYSRFKSIIILEVRAPGGGGKSQVSRSRFIKKWCCSVGGKLLSIKTLLRLDVLQGRRELQIHLTKRPCEGSTLEEEQSDGTSITRHFVTVTVTNFTLSQFFFRKKNLMSSRATKRFKSEAAVFIPLKKKWRRRLWSKGLGWRKGFPSVARTRGPMFASPEIKYYVLS